MDELGLSMYLILSRTPTILLTNVRPLFSLGTFDCADHHHSVHVPFRPVLAVHAPLKD